MRLFYWTLLIWFKRLVVLQCKGASLDNGPLFDYINCTLTRFQPTFSAKWEIVTLKQYNTLGLPLCGGEIREQLQNTQLTKCLSWKTATTVAVVFCYAENFNPSESNDCSYSPVFQ